jgi:hypothetical protein
VLVVAGGTSPVAVSASGAVTHTRGLRFCFVHRCDRGSALIEVGGGVHQHCPRCQKGFMLIDTGGAAGQN